MNNVFEGLTNQLTVKSVLSVYALMVFKFFRYLVIAKRKIKSRLASLKTLKKF